MKTRASAIRGRKQTWSPQLILWGILILNLIVNLALPLNLTAAPGWTSVAAMQAARSGHTATLLSDGRVLVAGGNNGAALDSAEIYNPGTNSWSPAAHLIMARSGHTATLLTDGRVLVAGGSDNSVTLASAEIYDPPTNTWTSTTNMKAARSNHTATLLPDGRVLLAGGWIGPSLATAKAEIYDQATGTWTLAADMHTARIAHKATLLPNGWVLVAGGWNTNNGLLILNKSETYDPVTGTWTMVADLLTSRTNHTATLLTDGRVLVVGGSNGIFLEYAKAEIYNPAANTWTPAPDMNTAHSSHTATLLADGRVLMAGGLSGGSIVEAETYNPVTNDWGPVANLKTARSSHTATLLADGRVLVAGGSSGGSIASAEIYDPATMAWTSLHGGGGTWAHSATLLPDGRVLFAGGGNVLHPISGSSDATATAYDPASSTSMSLPPMMTGRQGHTATLLPNGRVLVAGGSGGGYDNAPIAGTELFNPATHDWTPGADMQAARLVHTSTLLADGRVLVAGGSSGGNANAPIASVEIYDPLKNIWTSVSDLETARSGHRATLLPEGRILVTGGNNPAITGAKLYDPATNTWTSVAPMQTGRSGHTATLLPDGRVLVAGGNTPAIAGAELYNPATNSWTSVSAMATARSGHTATLLPDGRVLVVGGDSFTVPDNVEVYDPAMNTWIPVPMGGTGRTGHTATLLLDGRVLVAGGWVAFSSIVAFDRGLGYNSLWRPTITTIPTALALGSNLTLTGTGFRGYQFNEASGGGANASASNYPLVQVRRLDNEQLAWLDPGTPFSATSFSSGPATQILPGPAVATVFVNGIPSLSRYLQIKNTNLFLPLIVR